MTSEPHPLKGIRVIDAGLLVQGPQAATLLGDLGADVIKIELPKYGDQSRHIRISATDPRSAYFAACNRGKRSVTLSLSSAEGSELFKRLIRTANVLITNFSSGTMDSWGLGYEALRAINPNLIYAAGNTFGPVGPDSHRKGADLAAQCAGGLISTTGRDQDPPTPVGVTIADHIASLNLACGILAALYEGIHTGAGKKVETSLLGGQIWAQAAEYTHTLMTGTSPGRSNFGHPLIHGIYRIFETSNGWFGIIGVHPGQREELCSILDRPDLVLDPRMQETPFTEDRLNWLLGQLEESFQRKSTEEWCSVFAGSQIRFAPVHNYEQVIEDPGVWRNGYLAERKLPSGENHRYVGSPLRLNDVTVQSDPHVPSLGEHTEEIFREIGVSSEEIVSLRDRGVI